MNTRTKKIMLMIVALIIGICISTKAQAAYPEWFEVQGPVGGNYQVRQDNGAWIFCIQHMTHYEANYAGEFGPPGELKQVWDTFLDGMKPPPGGQNYGKYTMEYNWKENIDARAHQDVAYILAFAANQYDNATNQEIWSTSLNEGTKVAAGELGVEAASYKTFYNTIHPIGFQNLVTDRTNTANVKVAVNSDKSYTAGPFNVSYPDGTYKGKNKFSWIEKLVAVTDTGEVGAEIYTATGEKITMDRLGKDGNATLNGKDFYIKFKSDSAKKVSVKVDFGYIESCEAVMKRYTGEKYLWHWTYVYKETSKHDVPDGGEWKRLHGDGYNPAGCDQLDENGNCSHRYWVEKTKVVNGIRYTYRLDKTDTGIQSQTMLIVEASNSVKPTVNESRYSHAYKGTASKTLAPIGPGGSGGIDLTMEISGKVFLDQDQGKVNEGNNRLDANEQLAGVEVRLYEANGKQVGIKLTDANGYYEFKGLNALKKYYVRFTYNGMLYTNVLYNENGDNTSKAIEDGQGNDSNRKNFNNKFAEIGSEPHNYQTKDFETGKTIQNKVYLQENIASLFKELASSIVANGGNEINACKAIIAKYNTDKEIRQKVQFIMDCRINAYTVKQYPLSNEFVIEWTPQVLAGKGYVQIYSGKYSQKNVNLGIKARPTVDLALYKDVAKAEVSINGKTETYKYNLLQKAEIGVSESDYLNGLRNSYRTNAKYNNEKQTRPIENDTYTLNTRKEEVTNGGSINRKNGGTPYELNDTDQLKIDVTYKIAIVNQSSTIAAITEVVDYYDKNYEFISAYVGNDNGEKIGEAEWNENSKYGANTEYKSGAYKTMYIRPKAETRLDNNNTQYIYVTLRLRGEDDAGKPLSAGKLLEKVLKDENSKLLTMNLAEINGYKTYNKDGSIPGLIDIDSNPGNLNISNIKALTEENIINYPNIRAMYEDDTRRAPTMIFKLHDARKITGTVFEDSAYDVKDDSRIHTKSSRRDASNGELDDDENTIEGVIVELVEIKNGKMITRAITRTDDNGNYSFEGFIPGNYTIRYTYGNDEQTSMTTNSPYTKGLNKKSYNGQDYEAAQDAKEKNEIINTKKYKVTNQQGEDIREDIIEAYNSGIYWYTDTAKRYSDAKDDKARVEQVIQYSKSENGKEIVNHKAEVFNAYVNPQPRHITKEDNDKLRKELEDKTHRYAYTPEIEVEVEYATKTKNTTSDTNNNGNKYDYNITGIDFGIVERPRSELLLDQDIKNIKVTAADGTVLFDEGPDGKNIAWIPENGTKEKFEKWSCRYFGKDLSSAYGKEQQATVTMDEELINGAKLEVTYELAVYNLSEVDRNATTRAKNVINYVSNNLNFDAENNGAWEVVTKESIQKDGNDTYINPEVDLSTQSVILKTTEDNPLTKPLALGENATAELKLTKILSTESSNDDLSYTNLAEIVEIENTVGRYDHGAVPGNQKLDRNPTEHDAAGASKYHTPNRPDIPDEEDTPPDGIVTIIPPTGSNYIYYVIGITSLVILAAGIYVIKKFIIDKKK